MANPPNSNSGQLISPFDQRVYDIPATEHERYKAAGWFSPTAEADEHEVHDAFSNWRQMGTAESALYSASEGWLGLPSLIEKGSHAVGHDDWAKNYANSVMLAHQQHPIVSDVAKLGGNVVSAGAYTAAAIAAAPVVAGAAGIGAAGVGAAELAGAAGVAEAAVTAGEAAAAGTEALGIGSRIAQAAPALGKLGATLAAEGAAIGIVDRYDQAAIQHAYSPEGQEKVVWSIADIARDAAINGTLGVGLVGGAKLLAGLGKKLQGTAVESLVSASLDRVSAEAVNMQGRLGELRQAAKEILPLGLKKGKAQLENVVIKSEKEMNQVKFEMRDKDAFLDESDIAEMRQMAADKLAGTVEGSRVLRAIDTAAASGNIDVHTLQQLRDVPYAEINFKDFASRPVNLALRDTGLEFGQYIKRIFDRVDTSAGTAYADTWHNLDKSYSTSKLLLGALRGGADATTLGDVATKVASSAAISGAIGATTGFMGGGLNAMKAGAGYKLIQSIKPGHFAAAGQAFGNILTAADRKLATVTMQRLRNTPVVAINHFKPAEYQQLTGKLAMIAADPTKASANTHQALTTAGVPDDVATDLTGKLHAQNMYLTEQLQHQTGPADMPSLGHGDPVKLRKVAGQAATMADPTHGIAYPTQANLEVLKKFYPQTLMTAQAAVYVQLRKNARMSPQAKQWASRLLGRPINNLSSPQFSAMLQQSRAASEQAAQQAKGSSRGSRPSSQGEDTGSQTRLDELQGGS